MKYRGEYELNFIEFCQKNNVSIESIDAIKYQYKYIERVYFPDFFIPSLNLIVEIKSKYYYEKYIDKNIAKQEGCISLGYNFIFLIDKNYDLLKELL